MVKLQSFNIDIQNGTASFFFQSTESLDGKTPRFAQINIPVDVFDSTTTQAIRQEGAVAAEHFLQEIIDEIKKVK